MSEAKNEINYIVRILGKDLDGTKPINESLRGIKGMGHRISGIIANKFCKENNIKADTRIGELNAEQIKTLEGFITKPQEHGLPNWTLNRQRDYETGENIHLSMNDLDFQLRNDFTRLAEIKSYRGLRHTWGLTVRGQKTKSTHRRGGKVGVSKKDAKK